MKSTQFCTGFVSNGLSTRTRASNDSRSSKNSCCSLRRGKGCDYVAVNDGRELLNNASIVGDCRLSVKHTATLSSLITQRRRKPRYSVVSNHSNKSGPVLDSADVEESLAVEQEIPLRNSDEGTV